MLHQFRISLGTISMLVYSQYSQKKWHNYYMISIASGLAEVTYFSLSLSLSSPHWTHMHGHKQTYIS